MTPAKNRGRNRVLTSVTGRFSAVVLRFAIR
jgi:hypothetical protein